MNQPRIISAREVNGSRRIPSNTELRFNSMYEACKEIGVNTGVISMCYRSLNWVKSGISKTTGKRYIFRFGYIKLTWVKLGPTKHCGYLF